MRNPKERGRKKKEEKIKKRKRNQGFHYCKFKPVLGNSLLLCLTFGFGSNIN
jgi:hypothetical protein